MERYLFMIEQWGIWSRCGGTPDFRAKSSMLHVMQLVKPNGLVVPSITDDDAIKMDQAVAMLGAADKKLKEIIFLHFVCDYSLQQIAIRLEVTRSSVSRQLWMATGFLVGVMTANAKSFK